MRRVGWIHCRKQTLLLGAWESLKNTQMCGGYRVSPEIYCHNGSGVKKKKKKPFNECWWAGNTQGKPWASQHGVCYQLSILNCWNRLSAIVFLGMKLTCPENIFREPRCGFRLTLPFSQHIMFRKMSWQESSGCKLSQWERRLLASEESLILWVQHFRHKHFSCITNWLEAILPQKRKVMTLLKIVNVWMHLRYVLIHGNTV